MDGIANGLRLPYNQSAELAVLGAVLADGNMDALTLDVPLRDDDFYCSVHKQIFRIMQQLDAQGAAIDYITVSNRLAGIDNAEDVLRKIAVQSLTGQSVKHYARIVKQNAARRRCIEYAREIAAKAADPQLDYDTLQNDIAAYEWNRVEDNEMTDGGAAVVEAYQSIIDAAERKGAFPGIPTGWKDFDLLTGGFCDGELTVIGARPSMGKTMFVQNIAEFAVISRKEDVALFSLEMSSKEIMNRMIASRADVKFRNLRFGTLSGEEYERIGIFCSYPELSKLHICDKIIGVAEIKAHCRKLKRSGKAPKLIIIDYLQIIPIQSSGRGTRNDEVGQLTRELKILAKEMNCPVICLSQLSRAPANRVGNKPQLSDLRESGAIEQDADMVIFLHRDEYYNPDTERKGLLDVIVAKARNGKLGTAVLAYQPEYMRIANVEFRSSKADNHKETSKQVSLEV